MLNTFILPRKEAEAMFMPSENDEEANNAGDRVRVSARARGLQRTGVN